jgi:hypothetical protein
MMSVTELGVESMARKSRNADGSTATVPVKMDRALAAKAKIVASDRGVDTAAYISESLRPIVERDWGKIVKRIEEGGK